jgi:hypothetical protein
VKVVPPDNHGQDPPPHTTRAMQTSCEYSLASILTLTFAPGFHASRALL